MFYIFTPREFPILQENDIVGIGLLENMISTFGALNEKVNISIMGDLNARTAERSDFIQDKNIVPVLEEYEVFLHDEASIRTSCDKGVNKSCLELLELCKVYVLRICNGRQGSDNGIGNFTFIGGGGNSVIHYVICSEDILSHIKTFNIEERTESHHFPVSISILSTFDTPVQTFSVPEEREKCFYKFNSAKTEAYKESLTNLLTNEFILNITQIIQDYSIDISVVLDQFLDIFYQCWSCCECVRKYFPRTQPTWFGERCKTMKEEKYRALRKYRS